MGYSSALSQGVTILIALHMQKNDEEREVVSSKLLSENIGIPLPSTVKILKGLSRAGITATKEGYNGGHTIIKPLSQITLLNVFHAVEQDDSLFKIHNTIPCDHPLVDALKERLLFCTKQASCAMNASLDKINLEQIWLGEFENSEEQQ